VASADFRLAPPGLSTTTSTKSPSDFRTVVRAGIPRFDAVDECLNHRRLSARTLAIEVRRCGFCTESAIFGALNKNGWRAARHRSGNNTSHQRRIAIVHYPKTNGNKCGAASFTAISSPWNRSRNGVRQFGSCSRYLKIMK